MEYLAKYSREADVGNDKKEVLLSEAVITQLVTFISRGGQKRIPCIDYTLSVLLYDNFAMFRGST